MCIYSTVRVTRAGDGFYKRTVFCRERLHLFIILAFCSPLLVPPDSSCRKCGKKSNAADQTGFLGNKTAGTRVEKGGVLGGSEFFTALLKYEPTKGCSKVIYATYVQ